MKFTDAKIRVAKAGIIWEQGGFGLRVSASGAKSFILMYRMPGDRTRRKWTLGRYPQITLATARRIAAQGREKIDKGIDPGAKAVARKKANREALTVTELVEEYLSKWARPRKKTWQEDERCLNREVVPAIGRKKAKDVCRRDIRLILDRIIGRGSPGMANRTLTVISKMFTFAVSRDIISDSPCKAISMPGEKGRKDRVLDASEIRSVWNGLDGAGMSEGIKLALKFQLVTAQRRGEVAGMEWKEIDSNHWWTIPAEKAKNGMSHRVPLSRLALELLDEIKILSKDSPYLFPSPRGIKPITGKAITRAVKKNMDCFNVPSFTPHDLRRTAASLMTGAGIPRLAVSKILNHAETGVTAVYDRHSYDDQKRQALETCSRKLESILTGKTGKVIPLQAT